MGSSTHLFTANLLKTGLAWSTVGAVFLVSQGWGFGLDFLLFSSFRIALESSRSKWKLLGGCMVWLGWGSKCPSVLVSLLLGPKCGHLHVAELHLWLSQCNLSSEPNLLQLCWNPGAQWWLVSTQQQFPFLRKKSQSITTPRFLHFKTLLHSGYCSSLNCSHFLLGQRDSLFQWPLFLLGKMKSDSGFPQISHSPQKMVCTNSHVQKKQTRHLTVRSISHLHWGILLRFSKSTKIFPTHFAEARYLVWAFFSHCLTYFSLYLPKSRFQGCLTVDLFYSFSVADALSIAFMVLLRVSSPPTWVQPYGHQSAAVPFCLHLCHRALMCK